MVHKRLARLGSQQLVHRPPSSCSRELQEGHSSASIQVDAGPPLSPFGRQEGKGCCFDRRFAGQQEQYVTSRVTVGHERRTPEGSSCWNASVR